MKINIPEYLILDSSDVVLLLERNGISKMTFIVSLCELLIIEDDADAELYNSNNIPEWLDTDLTEMHRLSRAVNILGMRLLTYLREIKAYKNGILPYVYYRMLNNDIVMRRSDEYNSL